MQGLRYKNTIFVLYRQLAMTQWQKGPPAYFVISFILLLKVKHSYILDALVRHAVTLRFVHQFCLAYHA